MRLSVFPSDHGEAPRLSAVRRRRPTSGFEDPIYRLLGYLPAQVVPHRPATQEGIHQWLRVLRGVEGSFLVTDAEDSAVEELTQQNRDLVQVLSGKDRGKQGRVLEARPRDRRVITSGTYTPRRTHGTIEYTAMSPT